MALRPRPAGVDTYLGELMVMFEGGSGAAAAPFQQPPRHEDDEDFVHGAASDEDKLQARRRWAVEQIASAGRLGAAGAAAAGRAARFLAAHALLHVPHEAAGALGAPAEAPKSSKKGSRKERSGGGGGGAAKGGGSAELASVARCAQAPPSREVRQLCGARLIALVAAVGHAAHQQQQQDAAAGAAGAGGKEAAQQLPPGKRAKAEPAGGGKEAQEEQQPPAKRAKADPAAAAAAAAAQRDAAAAAQARLLADALGFVGAALSQQGVVLALELPEAVAEATEQLQEVEGALGEAGALAGGPRAARARALLHLVRLLRLQVRRACVHPLGEGEGVRDDAGCMGQHHNAPPPPPLVLGFSACPLFDPPPPPARADAVRPIGCGCQCGRRPVAGGGGEHAGARRRGGRAGELVACRCSCSPGAVWGVGGVGA